MGWFKKAFKKVVRVATGGLLGSGSGTYSMLTGGLLSNSHAKRVIKKNLPSSFSSSSSAPEQPEVIETPAPAQTQQLGDTEGSAEKEKDTKAKARKGKKSLKIEATSAGRNIV